jgi:EmrB/QacA subfamily drug resistance transporter
VPELLRQPLARLLLTEPARPDRIRGLPRASWLAVATVCVGAFMGQLDASIVTVALPRLRDSLHVSLGAAEWVALSYLLVLVGSVTAVGRIADVFGRKLLYCYGFALFSLTSLGCGLSSTLAVLLAFRTVQAIGAALLQANSVALIRTTVSPGQLNRAIGLQGAAQALGLALGPTIGGLLIAAGGWRWVFWVNLPIGLLGIGSGLLLLPRTRVRASAGGFDWTGLGCLLPATGALLLGLSMLADRPAWAIGLILLGLAGLAGFGLLERRAGNPLIEPSLLHDRALRTGLSGALLGYLVLFAALFLCPLYLQARLHLPAAQAGLLVSILPAALATLAPVAGLAADRYGPGRLTAAGMAITGLGCCCAVLLAGQLAGLVLLLALTGAGLGLFTPANNATVAGRGRLDQAGVVSGVLNMTRGLGTALGVAVAGACYGLAEGPVAGFRLTCGVLAVLALLGPISRVCGRRNRSAARLQHLPDPAPPAGRPR